MIGVLYSMKNTREIAKEYRMSHWAEIMRRRTESGMSITKFCAVEGMHVNRYHYWQRRLRAAAVKELMPVKAEPTAPVPSGWTQITTVAEAGTDLSSADVEKREVIIEIGKCRIAVNDSTEPELLNKVCKVLVALC